MQRQQCPHIFRDLRRGGNSSAECAKCAVCKLNWSAGDRGHYIFMMTDEAHGTFALTTEADEALADSGCRVAVGGEEWHSRLQGVMAALGIEFFEVEEDERFKFGSGTVLLQGGHSYMPLASWEIQKQHESHACRDPAQGW